MTGGASSPALAARGVTVRFGGLVALADLDLSVQAGARHGVLGPNGSGKTTLFNVLSGFVRPAAGRVALHGVDLTALPPHRRVAQGLARTFQITTLFPQLTAGENVLMAALVTTRRQRAVWRPARREEGARELALRTLEDLGLRRLAERPVRDLGYGEQRQLEIALALATGPRVLLLDEPTAGLSAAETGAVRDLVRGLPSELTVVLIEHDLGVVFDLADHLTVLHNGVRIADGPAEAVRDDPEVKRVYLGGG